MMSHHKKEKVAVLGAGIMGLCVGYVLSEAGYYVDIFDPMGFPADNASFMAGGMLAPYAEIEHMPQAWIDVGLDGIAFWENIAHGREHLFDFSQNGSLLLAHEEDRYILERFKAHLPAGIGHI